MTPPDLFPSDDGADLAAAEYALGVLDAPGRAEAERRRGSEPAFAAEVEAWERRLAPLLAGAIAEPSSGVWPAIERRLGPRVIDFAAERDRRSTDAKPGGLEPLALWRGATLALGALAAALVVVVAWPKRPVPQVPAAALMSARLTDPRGAALFVATLDRGHGQLVLAPASAAALAGRSPELWLIPDGAPPISLGVAQFDHPVRLARSASAGAAGRLTLAVTSEPLGGSPTGRPTGPILASGKLERL